MKRYAFPLGEYKAVRRPDGCTIWLNQQTRAAGETFIQYIDPATGNIILKRKHPIDLRAYFDMP
jgi:hypothetical protein